MNLSNLQPAEGSTHSQNKRLGREVLEKVVLLQEVTKEKSRSGYSKRLVLKEGKCHFKDVFLSSVFTTSISKDYEGVNLDTLQLLVDNGVTDTVDMTTYVANRLATKMKSLRF
jgi:large subunit ribosomal protein L15